MAAEAQKLFDLIDSYWFAHQIFKITQIPPHKIQKTEESTPENLDFSAIPTINIRSYSDQLFINPKHQSFISESALSYRTPKLETIFSGSKESKEIKLPVKSKEKRRNNKYNENKSKSKSKSLSELEFEEVKGFMDLGFVFSEKDKLDSNLVSIIPGLQRLGKDVKEIEEEKLGEEASRPYLSEAWSDLKNRRLIKIPAFADEKEIKHQLKFWAHSVASVVR